MDLSALWEPLEVWSKVVWTISSGSKETYRLVDPNGRELTALIHGNQLIKANIKTVNELQDLWVSPKAKDKLRKRNRNIELISSYSENTDILN